MRVSESTIETWFTPQLRRMMVAIDQRLELLIPSFAARREYWQATRYRVGGKFEDHFDCGHWSTDPEGDREHTVLLHLDTPRRGGHTRFSRLDVEVKVCVGRLVVWCNLTPDNERDPEMLHAGMPLKAGRKTMLVTWVRQRIVHKGG